MSLDDRKQNLLCIGSSEEYIISPDETGMSDREDSGTTASHHEWPEASKHHINQ